MGTGGIRQGLAATTGDTAKKDNWDFCIYDRQCRSLAQWKLSGICKSDDSDVSQKCGI